MEYPNPVGTKISGTDEEYRKDETLVFEERDSSSVPENREMLGK